MQLIAHKVLESVNQGDPELEAELLRRLDDPRPGVEATPEFWADLKRRVRDGQHLAQRS
jgi:hypothetical protein